MPHTPGPWSRLLKAAKEAQGILQSEHANLTSGEWDDREVMQIFEDIECALLDISEKGPPPQTADASADLLAACEAAMIKFARNPLDKVSVAADMIRAAIAKGKQSP